MLNAYRIELRRSPLLTAFPVVIALDLLVLFGRSRYWIGVWPEASVAVQVVTLFLGPVLSGVSAWQAGRSSRAGMPETVLAAARPFWRTEAARLAATLTLGFLAYLVGCLTAVAVSTGEAGPGFLWPSYRRQVDLRGPGTALNGCPRPACTRPSRYGTRASAGRAAYPCRDPSRRRQRRDRPWARTVPWVAAPGPGCSLGQGRTARASTSNSTSGAARLATPISVCVGGFAPQPSRTAPAIGPSLATS